MMIEKHCLYCNNLFVSYKCHNQKLCSRQCKYKYLSLKRGEETPRFNKDVPFVDCFECGSTFRKHPFQYFKTKTHFCSKECYSENRKDKAYKEYICFYCNKNFMRITNQVIYKRVYCSKECSYKNRSGDFNPFYGKQHNEITKKKMSENHWDINGKNNPSYKNGNSRFPYPLGFNKKLKKEIRKRDNYLCQICFITEKESKLIINRKLDVHHIDEDKNNNLKNNLISLCRSCHGKMWKKEEEFVKYFKQRIERNENNMGFKCPMDLR